MEGVRSLLFTTSLYQNMMSSAVNGSPSDHLLPSRRLMVHWVKSSFGSTLSAYFISTLAPSMEKRTRPSLTMRMRPLRSDGPVKPRCQMPPYWPISGASMTYGFLGRRSSTGGSVPALTRSASIGASRTC